MKFQIFGRWNSQVKYECELGAEFESMPISVQLGAAIKKALESGSDLSGSDLRDSNLSDSDLSRSDLSDSDLRGSDLRDSDLRDSNLSDSDLSGSDLSGSDLRDSNLRDSDLRDSDLRDSNLSGSDLRGSDLRDSDLSRSDLSGSDLRDSNLRDSDLRDSDLRDSNLSGSDLRGSDLRGSDLRDSDLSRIKSDFFDVLLRATREIPGLELALKEGRVDGSTYEGECACLVGTIANVRHCNHNRIPNLAPDSSRPAEQWFLGIRKGDTPATNKISAITLEWITEFNGLLAAAK